MGNLKKSFGLLNNLINTEEYRSGHNEAVLKTVWVKAHGGSNPSSSAKNTITRLGDGFFSWLHILCEGFERQVEPQGSKCDLTEAFS